MTFRGYDTEYDIEEVFHVDCGSRITEKEVYHNIGKIPVVTSKTKEDGITWLADEKWLLTKGRIFSGECISWTKEGYAGKMFYRNYKFFPIDVSGVLKVKKEFKDKIDLHWFRYTQQNLFYKSVYSRSTQGKLYQETTKKIRFRLIDIEKQKKIANKYNQLSFLITQIEQIKKEIKSLLNIHINSTTYENEDYLSNIFDAKGGNSGLTEKVIYANPPLNKNKEINVYSGSVCSESLLGFVDKNTKIKNKNIKIFEGPCIVVTRKGLAGTMVLRSDKQLTINDDAYVLELKEKYKNNFNWKWFYYVHSNLLKKISTAKEGNGTFSKQKMTREKIKFPNKNIQDRIVKKYEALLHTWEKVNSLQKKCEKLLLTECA